MLTSCWDLFGPWRNAADPYSQYKAELVASTDSTSGLMYYVSSLSVIPGVGVACYCWPSTGLNADMYQFSKGSSGWAAPTALNLVGSNNSDYTLGPDGDWYYFVTGGTQGAQTLSLTRLVPPSATTTLFTTNPAAYDYVGGVAVKADGTVFLSVMSDFKIYKVTLGGVVSVYAGTGTQGAAVTGDGGSATSAALCGPVSMALAADGSLYFEDDVGWKTTTNGGWQSDRQILRKIDTSGKLSTVAFNGSGTPGNGDGYPAADSNYGIGQFCLAADGTLFYYSGDKFTR